MGGSRSDVCNKVAHKIWIWCNEKGMWLTVSHIAGKLNIQADLMSRKFNDDTEWKLDSYIFTQVVKVTGMPNVVLFATRLNYQIKAYVSWHPDPESCAVEAFTLEWKDTFCYTFPPFSLIK